jgi:hypothetical protein
MIEIRIDYQGNWQVIDHAENVAAMSEVIAGMMINAYDNHALKPEEFTKMTITNIMSESNDDRG